MRVIVTILTPSVNRGNSDTPRFKHTILTEIKLFNILKTANGNTDVA